MIYGCDDSPSQFGVQLIGNHLDMLPRFLLASTSARDLSLCRAKNAGFADIADGENTP
jgi:hypothetical protein